MGLERSSGDDKAKKVKPDEPAEVPAVEPLKRKFIRVIGMQRSGIHAVADWIRMSHAGMGYSSWYDNAVNMDRPNDIAKFLPPSGEKAEPFLWMVEHEDIMFVDVPLLNEKIYNNFEFTDVLVIRDLFNTMASRRKMDERFFNRRTIQQWKHFACEAQNLTNFLGPNKVVVNFNKWFSDMKYREEVAGKFGIDGVGVGTEKMAVQSYWQPTVTKSSDLALFDRWKNYQADKDFWTVFDRQAYDLNTSIFGKNEEVAKLIR